MVFFSDYQVFNIKINKNTFEIGYLRRNEKAGVTFSRAGEPANF